MTMQVFLQQLPLVLWCQLANDVVTDIKIRSFSLWVSDAEVLTEPCCADKMGRGGSQLGPGGAELIWAPSSAGSHHRSRVIAESQSKLPPRPDRRGILRLSR